MPISKVKVRFQYTFISFLRLFFFFTCWTRCGQVSSGVGHTVVARLTGLTDLLVGEVVVGSSGTSHGVRSSQGAVVGLRASSCQRKNNHVTHRKQNLFRHSSMAPYMYKAMANKKT